MKTTIKIIALFLLLILISCGNDDDNSPQEMEMEAASIVGDWARTSGSLLFEQPDYLIIEPNNTLAMFLEDEMRFRDEITGIYTDTETQLTINTVFLGNVLLNYTLDNNTLELTDSSGNTGTFIRTTNAPSSDTWITKIDILTQGDAPWNEDADIAFNGSHILLGNGYEADNIGLINPETFLLDSEIITTQSAFAVEVEKFDVPDKYIFQSSNGSTQFKAYYEDSNAEVFTSMNLGSWIYGLASINSTQVWASSGNEKSLYLLSYTEVFDQTIERTITLDRAPNGMDYQDSFLYVCSRGNIYKCDVSSSFEVLETITVEGYRAFGIAFDGTNFWINASSNDGGPNQLIKTSLTL